MPRTTRQRSTSPPNLAQRSNTARQPSAVTAIQPAAINSEMHPNERNDDRNEIDQVLDDCCTKSILGGIACAGAMLTKYYACRNSNKTREIEAPQNILKKTLPLTLLFYGTCIIFRLYYKTAKSTHQD
jgi:hypothetical protein